MKKFKDKLGENSCKYSRERINLLNIEMFTCQLSSTVREMVYENKIDVPTFLKRESGLPINTCKCP
jgi:hypothetical protein